MRTRHDPQHVDAARSLQTQGYAIDDLRALGLIAEAGSMNAAAKASGISKSVLSRAVAKLEAAAGGPVFDRGSGGMTLTGIGQVLLPVAERAIDLMRDGDEAMRSAGGVPQGRLAIAASALSGQKLVAPAMAAMAKRYPKVQMTLRVTGRGPDPVAEDLDIVIRIGRPTESHLQSRRLMASPLALYAFRSAAAQYDLQDPRTVERIGRIVIDVDQVPGDWELENGAGEKCVFDSEPIAHVGDPMVAIGIMNAGSGVAFIPMVYAEPLAKAGAIVRVLPDWTGPKLEIFATTPARRAAVPAVRAFLEILAEEGASLEKTAR